MSFGMKHAQSASNYTWGYKYIHNISKIVEYNFWVMTDSQDFPLSSFWALAVKLGGGKAWKKAKY